MAWAWQDGPGSLRSLLVLQKKFSSIEFQFLVSGFRHRYNHTQPARPSKKVFTNWVSIFGFTHTHHVSPYHKNHRMNLQFILQIVHTLTMTHPLGLLQLFSQSGQVRRVGRKFSFGEKFVNHYFFFIISYNYCKFWPMIFSHLKARISWGCLLWTD